MTTRGLIIALFMFSVLVSGAVSTDARVEWVTVDLPVSFASAIAWTHYGPSEGLSGRYVSHIAEDHLGNIWVATYNGTGEDVIHTGLSRFDGATWGHYDASSGSLRSDHVTVIFAEGADVWIGTKGGGVSQFDGENWTTYTTAEGLADDDVRSIVKDAQGNMWFGTSDGLSKFDGSHWLTYDTSNGLPENDINVLFADGSTIWVGTSGGGASGFDGNMWETFPNLGGAYSGHIRSIEKGDDGSVWLGTHNGLIRWNDGDVEEYMVADQIGGRFNVNIIDHLEKDTFGNIWFAVTAEAQLSTGGIAGRGQGVGRFDGHRIREFLNYDFDGNGVWEGGESIVAALDLDGDGEAEMVAASSAGYDLQPRSVAVYADGQEQWRYQMGPAPAAAFVAIGDINGDGYKEIVTGGTSPNNGAFANGTDDAQGFVLAFDHIGNNLWTTEVGKLYSHVHYVGMADLGYGAEMDIVAFGTMNIPYASGRQDAGGVYILDGSGELIAEYETDVSVAGPGIIANMDDTPLPEIIALDENGMLHILRNDLSAVLHERNLGEKSVLIAANDLNGDGRNELVSVVDSSLVVLDSHLSPIWQHPLSGPSSVILTDVVPGGPNEIVISSDEIYVLGMPLEPDAHPNAEKGWEHADYDLGHTRYYPFPSETQASLDSFTVLWSIDQPGFRQSILSGDVNGDGYVEIVASGGGLVRVIDRSGNELWVKEVDGSVAALDDVTGDGIPEVLFQLHSDSAADARFFIYDGRAGRRIEEIVPSPKPTDEIVGNKVGAIVAHRSGEVWFGTDRGGSVYDGERWTRFTTKNSGLAQNEILTAFCDRSGNMWFGTAGSGVARLDGTWETEAFIDEGILAVDTSGNVWVGSQMSTGDARGVYRYDGVSWINYTPQNTSGGLGGTWIRAIAPGPDGSMWFSVWSSGQHRGVSRFKDGNWITYTSTDSDLPDNLVHSMADDTDGRMWLSCGYQWLVVFDGTDWASYDLGVPASCMTADDRGYLWLGTPVGLARLDLRGRSKMKLFFENLPVDALGIDLLGNLWAAVDKNGVQRYDGRDWKAFSTQDGLIGDVVTSIAPDGLGNVWFGTHNGIGRYDGTEWIKYTKADGLPGEKILSMAADRSNNVWAWAEGTGIIVRHPEDVAPNTFITEAPSSPTVEDTVAFQFIGADVGTSTENLLYQWRLNEDEPWPSYTSDTRISIPLDIGVYVLSVRAIDKDGNEDPSPARYPFVVGSGARIEPHTGGGVEVPGGINLTIHANTFSQSVDVVISPTKASKQLTDSQVQLIGKAYRIDPSDLVLRKPAVLAMYIDADNGHRIPDSQKAAIFFDESESDESWTRIGGTYTAGEKAVRTAISRFGIYALGMSEADGSEGPAISGIDCQPRVFSPRGGSLDPSTAISFKLGKRSEVTVKVYNLAGELQRIVLRKASLPVGINVVEWDGRDEDGEVVRSGLYIAAAEAGGKRQMKTVSVLNK